MLTLIRIALTALALSIAAAPASAQSFSDQEKDEIGQVVREYLLANPEILEEAIAVLRDRRDKAAAEASAEVIAEKSEQIFNSEHQAIIGNPDGAITVVEFFDYNCGYCRRAVSDMTALLDTNKDLRMVLKEFPILSDGSVEAARVAAAVAKVAPDDYLMFHTEMFARPGQADGAKALEVAGDLGLDVDAVKAASESDDVTAGIQEVHALATALGISGTPSYVIGTEVVPGAIGYDGLQTMVSALRDCGTVVC